ncbi:MAG: hypothetical protein RL367_2723 [Pseudomonadota bacterium]
MSVAFRRESDEEHKEPRFEIPIPVGPNLVTAHGAGLIEAEVAKGQLRVAAETEELPLEDARRALRYWKTRLATARIMPPPPAGVVALGSRVTFRLKGNVRVIDIVGHDEASPANGSIAFSAPLARAMIGCEVGDLADFGGAADAIEIMTVAIQGV